MPSPSREGRKRVRLDYDERRALILKSARRLFCSKPYDEVSMHDLAEAAGVTRGLLHHYFGSKRDLYLEVVRGVMQVPTLPLLPAVADLPAELVWEASVDGWMDLMESNREVWLTAIRAGSTGRDVELELILDEARELVAERVLQALGYDIAAVSDELRAVVRGFGGLAEEVTREWLERRRVTRAQARALLMGSLPLLLDHVLPAVVAAGERTPADSRK